MWLLGLHVDEGRRREKQTCGSRITSRRGRGRWGCRGCVSLLVGLGGLRLVATRRLRLVCWLLLVVVLGCRRLLVAGLVGVRSLLGLLGWVAAVCRGWLLVVATRLLVPRLLVGGLLVGRWPLPPASVASLHRALVSLCVCSFWYPAEVGGQQRASVLRAVHCESRQLLEFKQCAIKADLEAARRPGIAAARRWGSAGWRPPRAGTGNLQGPLPAVPVIKLLTVQLTDRRLCLHPKCIVRPCSSHGTTCSLLKHVVALATADEIVLP